MRCKTIIPLLALPLLGGCLGPEYLMTAHQASRRLSRRPQACAMRGCIIPATREPPFDPKSFPSW